MNGCPPCEKQALDIGETLKKWVPVIKDGAAVKSSGSAFLRYYPELGQTVPERPDVYLSVDEMPQPSDCNQNSSTNKKAYANCKRKSVYNFYKENVNIPSEVIVNDFKGCVKVYFIVDEQGNRSEYKVHYDQGYGTKEEAIRLAKLLPQWKPGKHHGKAVKVMDNVKFCFKTK